MENVQDCVRAGMGLLAFFLFLFIIALLVDGIVSANNRKVDVSENNLVNFVPKFVMV